MSFVETFQKYTPVGPGTRTHSCPRRSTKSALPGTKVTAVGTSTNCSASCGSKRTVRCGMASCEILGTSINCSGTELSKSLSTSTSWSTICGTGTSRICTMGARSASCSTVCRWTRSCGPGGSTRPVGRLFVVQAEEHRLGRRSRPELGRALHLALLLPGPGLPLSS